MSSLPTLTNGRPFTWSSARAAGLTKHQIRSGRYRHLLRDVWVTVVTPDSRELRLAAATLVLPERAVLCGLTAAWIYGVDVRHQRDVDVHACFPAGGRVRSRPGLRVSQESLDDSDVTQFGAVRVTTPLRTTFDALRLLRGAERLVVADAMAHAKLVTVKDLRDYFRAHHRLRNLRVGEQLLDLVEPATESPMETRVRWELHVAGLPRPVAQFEVWDGAAFVARLDLAYPEWKIAIEYDGAWHWERRRHDDRRRDRLRALGWTVLVFSADDIFQQPLAMTAQVARALRAAAA